MEFLNLILEPLQEVFAKFKAFAPSLLAMLVILAVGIVLARVLRAALVKFLTAVKFDGWSDRMGFTTLMRKGDLWMKPSVVMGAILFWILIIVTLMVGYAVSSFISRAVLITAVNAGYHYAKLLAEAARVLLMLMILAMVMEELQIATSIVLAAFSIVFGGIVIALAIAFGVGGIGAARRIIERELAEEPPEKAPEDVEHL